MKHSRRDFLVKTAQGSVFISFGGMLTSCQTTASPLAMTAGGSIKMLYLEVTPQNQFILTFDKVEMGQGVITGQATLFGEEADIHPEKFTMTPATVNKAFAGSNGVQITAGSSSTFQRWTILREAGARYRSAVLTAASIDWNVPISQLSTENGMVFSKDGKKKSPYATFNGRITAENLANDVKLKKPEQFKYIGKFSRSIDRKPKSLGQASYAIDLNLPKKKVATVIRCPVHGGKLKYFNHARIKSVPGVIDAIQITAGVAIICERYYTALKVRRQISSEWIEWDIAKEHLHNTEAMFTQYRKALANDAPKTTGEEVLVSADYELPYLAHAPMEPQNCTVWRKKESLEMWVPTQSPTLSQNIGAALSGLDRDQVTVHVAKYLGGVFGRRTTDSTIDAVEIANKISDPVQVIWTREDDMHHSALRPMAVTRMHAIIKKDQVTTWKYQTVSQSMLQGVIKDSGAYFFPEWVPSALGAGLGNLAAGTMDLLGVMPIAKSGATQPYDLPYDIDTEEINAPLPTFFWRSVGHSLNGFFVESFVDEVAVGMNKDPYKFRQQLLRKEPRALAVLNRVADVSKWTQTPSNTKRALGIAYHFSYRTHCAQVADVEILERGIKIHKIFTVVDCGTVVNPHIVENQVRSSVIYGLSAILYGEITFKDGKVEQGNFDRYPVLRITETPEVDVYTMPSDQHPTGIGEPGLPAVASAVCNAIFRATGKRIRKLPLSRSYQT